MKLLSQYATVLSFALLVGAVLFGVLVVWPQVQSLRSLMAQNQEADQMLKTAEGYLESTKISQQMIEDHREEVNRVQSAIPLESNIALLYQRILDGGSAAGVIIETIGVVESAKEEEQDLRKLEVQLRAMGTYSSAKGFLQDLLRSYRIITIESLRLSPVSGDENTDRFSLEVRLRAYYVTE
ncbi:MAG: type 4a pilus biogenesis protein PilO [bacterium]|nr:type 4a pilus biogenesis protein PilO [bacterium]